MANPLHELLDKLYADFNRWTGESRQKHPEIEIVWNKDLDRFRDAKEKFRIKWIVVGHNPGKKERGDRNEAGLWMGRYFHPEGSSGSWTRLVLAHDVRCLRDEVLFLEKTPICSDDVEGLKKKKGKGDNPLFTEMLEGMAKAVHDLQEATEASVWIQGYSDACFEKFFQKLGDLYGATEAAKVRKKRVFKTPHIGNIIRSGNAFPVESLLEEGLAKALPEIEGFEWLAPESG
ncbi:hypothetical protein [Archangium lansingense]|uniref:Uncharacterized protein n=1 Tax=Archangium lansingense TaxID=2995310 RepID=A0ABT4AQ47_9BACT|nr:hypothetical protein [Archangium lansinium]MCY1083284.1 hypothetical protein [Archangium lansinium]